MEKKAEKEKMKTSHRGKTEDGFVLLRTLIALTLILVCVSVMLSSFSPVMKLSSSTAAKTERIIAEQNKRSEYALQ